MVIHTMRQTYILAADRRIEGHFQPHPVHQLCVVLEAADNAGVGAGSRFGA